MTRKKRNLIVVLILLSTCVLGGLLWFLLDAVDFQHGRYKVTRVSLGKGRTATVYGQFIWDQRQQLYCVVRGGNGPRIPTQMLGVRPDPPPGPLVLFTRSAEQGDLVGIFENHAPRSAVALYDFKSGKWWPSTKYLWDWDDSVGRELLKRLNAAWPAETLKLKSDGVESNDPPRGID